MSRPDWNHFLFTFITMDLIDHIVSCTNIYIENRKAKFPYPREKDCKLTSRSEIQALFGALFLISVKKRKPCKRFGIVVQ